MKKKFAFMLLAVMIAVSCVFGLTACSGNENEHVHSLEYHAKVEPTCTTDGNIEYWSCSGCGKNFSDENGKIVVSSTILKASGHSLSYQNRVEPTCITNGNIEHFSCSNCGKAFLDENAETEISDIVIPSSHKPNNVLDYNNDYHWYVCEVCNEKVDVTAHSFNTVGICECGHKRNPEELDYVLSDDKSYYILAGIGRSTDNRLYVADSVNGKPVKEIKAEAFKNNATISSVYIPDSVTTIGDNAFYYCSSLTTITIGNGLTTMGSYIFQGCPITDATLPTSALSLLPRQNLVNVTLTSGESIRNFAFSGSSLLQSITIPNSVTTIGSDAFSGCSALEEVSYLGDIAGWCKMNFVDWEANPLNISKNVRLYVNYSYIFDLVIPDNVTSIGNYAFFNYKSLRSVTIPNSVTTIGDDAFRGCNALTTVTIGNGLTTMGSYIFQGCPIENAFIHTTALNLLPREKLLNVKITGGESIRKYAFLGSSLLQSITIPNSVTTIESDAFSGCSALVDVNYLGNVAGWCNINFVDAEANPLYFSRNVALIINNEVITNLVIPDGVTRIGDYAFYDYKSLTCVTIPNSVTSIGTYAFMGCPITSATTPTIAIDSIPKTYIKNLTISGGENIKKSAFSGSSLLQSITITDGVISIGSDAFKDCSALANVTLPSTLTHIDSGAFAFCRAISTVHYLGDVAGWCNISFVDRTSNPIQKLTKLYIGDELLTELVVPDSVSTIKDYAFYNCYTLASVTLPDSVTSIGEYAFYYNTALQGVTIPNSVTSIGKYAFYNCVDLINVTIGSGVTNIGSYAFESCTSLKEVFYKGTSEGWGKINLNSYNVTIENVTKYWYSETEPITVGNYWHYDVDGKTIVKW